MQGHSKPWTILASLPLRGVSATGALFVTKPYCIWLSGGFGPVGPAPNTGPFWTILFSSLKRPQRESQGPVALLPGCFTEDVLFNREACGVPGGERGGYYQSWAVKSRPREARVRENED